jgi:hypothetical protein
VGLVYLLKIVGHRIKGEKGSAVVLLAIAMTALLSVMALVTDVGINYVKQVRLSVAADAAALAGGTKLAQGQASVIQAAEYVGEKNGVPRENILVEVDDNGVTVTAEGASKVFFARIFGAQDGRMQQSARVAKTRPIAFFDVFPLGVDEVVKLDYSKEVNLFSKELLGSGNWGALSFKDEDGNYMTGASILREYLKTGYSGIVTLGDWVLAKGGVNMGPISEGIDYRFEEAAKTHVCGLGECPSDCPRILILPIYTPTNAKDEFEIVDFAAFWVTKVLGGGANTEVWGHFVRPIVHAAASVEGESAYGLTDIKLVQ